MVLTEEEMIQGIEATEALARQEAMDMASNEARGAGSQDKVERLLVTLRKLDRQRRQLEHFRQTNRPR